MSTPLPQSHCDARLDSTCDIVRLKPLRCDA
jgi:hypothetical protein